MNKKIPCNLALVGSNNPRCRIMERLYERFGHLYSPSGDISCVGMGEAGCPGGFSEQYVRKYKWKQRIRKF